MKRIAFFAHYDRDGIIDDYVVYYLRGLQHVASRVLFVSDCELKPGEAAKLDGLAELVFAGRHGEYDFGSWKRCFEHLDYDLSGWDELVIANDSCYAPVFPFEHAFTQMSTENCDFWSPSASEANKGLDHLSSYFLVIRKPILADRAFLAFWTAIKPQPNANMVVQHYEKGLTQLLLRRGYSWSSLSPVAPIAAFMKTDYVHQTLQTYKMSWLKVRLVRENPYHAMRLGTALQKICRRYPRSLIDSHLRRVAGTSDPDHHHHWLGPFSWAPIGGKVIRANLKLKKNRWWKFYAYIFGVPVFAFVLPHRPRPSPGVGSPITNKAVLTHRG